MAETWNMDVIKYFIKIAELKNITAAANELFVTQPTMTHQMQKIETRLGITLYNRLRTGIVLTSEGEQFYQHCKKLMAAYDEFNSAVYMINSNIIGTLKIGYPKSSISMLRLFNGSFVQLYPNVLIKNFRQGQENGINLLLDSSVDFFYLHELETKNMSLALKSMEVGSNPFMLLMSTKNPLSGRKSVHISELKDMRFVMPSRNHAAGRVALLNQVCAENGFAPNIINYHWQQSEYILDIVTYPDVVSIQPKVSNDYFTDNEDNSLIYVPLEGYPKEDKICLTWLSSNSNPLVKLYTNNVGRIIKEAKKNESFIPNES